MSNLITFRDFPPIRALAINQNGVIEVIDSKDTGVPQVIDTWEDENPTSVLAVSLTNSTDYPLLAIARSNSEINILDTGKGVSIFQKNCDPDDPIVGLHVFSNHTSEPDSTRSCKLFTCTQNGDAKIDRYVLETAQLIGDSMTWNVDDNCHLLFSKIHEMETLSIFGGKNAALHACNLETGETIWTAGHNDVWPREISFTSGAFIGTDHHSLVAGSDIHNVSLFDIRQHQPCQIFDLYLEKPGKLASTIRAIVESSDNNIVYIGTDSGDLFSLDLRTGHTTYFRGYGTSSHRHLNFNYDHPPIASSGPIRFLNRHHQHQLIASAGDYTLDIWNTDSRSLIAKVDMKENLSHVLFDYNSYEEADQSQAKPLQVYQRRPRYAQD